MNSLDEHEAQARRSYDAARFAVWAQDDWDEGVAACVVEVRNAWRAPGRGECVRVLDVGCGVGRLTAPLARIEPHRTFVGYDPSPSMIEHAKEHAGNPWNVSYTRDITHLPRQRDFAFSVAVMQHLSLDEKRDLLGLVRRSLAEDGVFFCQFVLGGVDERGPINFPMTSAEVIALLEESGFVMESLSWGKVFPTWVWATARKAP